MILNPANLCLKQTQTNLELEDGKDDLDLEVIIKFLEFKIFEK